MRRRKTTKEERARGRRAVQEHRDRVRKGFGCYLVAIDSVTLDALVDQHYLTDAQVLDKASVNRALSRYLWNQTHQKIL